MCFCFVAHLANRNDIPFRASKKSLLHRKFEVVLMRNQWIFSMLSYESDVICYNSSHSMLPMMTLSLVAVFAATQLRLAKNRPEENPLHSFSGFR